MRVKLIRGPSEQEKAAAGFKRAEGLPQGWARPPSLSSYAVGNTRELVIPPDGVPELVLSFLSRHHGFEIGLNCVKLFAFEDDGNSKFGCIDSIFNDLHALGVRFIRQPGNVNLTWRAANSMPVYTEGGDEIYSAFASEMGGGGGAGTRTAKLEQLFRYAARYRIQIVLTVLTYGGAATVYGETDPRGEITTNPLAQTWDAVHLDSTIADYVGGSDTTYSFTDTDSGGVDSTWALGTLDLRSAYKRQYVYLIANAAACLLRDVAATLLAEGIDLFEHLKAVEIFNEVNTGNLYATPSDGAGPWAKAFVAALAGLYDGFTARDRTTLPVIWLPSLASASRSQSVVEIVSFNGALASEIQSAADEAGRGSLLTLVSNQDWHWYRFSNSQDPTQIMCLSSSIVDLQAVVSALPSTITVCETGCPARTDEEVYDYRLYDYFTDTSYEDEDLMQIFQARQLIHKLAVAACAGATAAAWHTHIASHEGRVDTFFGCGLREDMNPDDARADTALPRRSWGALQRFIRLTAYGGGPSGAGFLPPIRGEALHLVTSDSTAMGNTIVLRFHTASGRYVYIFFMDAMGDASWRVDVEVTGGGWFIQYPSIPEDITGIGGDGTVLPSAMPTWGASVSCSMGDSFTLQVDQDPIYLVSLTALSFRMESGTAILDLS